MTDAQFERVLPNVRLKRARDVLNDMMSAAEEHNRCAEDLAGTAYDLLRVGGCIIAATRVRRMDATQFFLETAASWFSNVTVGTITERTPKGVAYNTIHIWVYDDTKDEQVKLI